MTTGRAYAESIEARRLIMAEKVARERRAEDEARFADKAALVAGMQRRRHVAAVVVSAAVTLATVALCLLVGEGWSWWAVPGVLAGAVLACSWSW